MRPISAAILTIGDELLRGELVDTNASWLSVELFNLGIMVGEHRSVGDDLMAISAAIGALSAEYPLLLVSGGLGPTEDDRTVASLARLLGVELALDEATLAQIKSFFLARGGIPMSANNERQAWIPVGSTALPNRRGTAPGVSLEHQCCQIFCFPGVPMEQRWLFREYVIPWARGASDERPVWKATLKCFGIGESAVDEKLVGLLDGCVPAGLYGTVHYRAAFPEVHVTVVLQPAPDEGGARSSGEQDGGSAALCEVMERAARRLGERVFSKDGSSLAETAVETLRQGARTLAVADSFSGGALSELITDVVSSEEVFLGGLVACSEKEHAAAVRGAGICLDTAVLGANSGSCREIAMARARTIRELTDAHIGLALILGSGTADTIDAESLALPSGIAGSLAPKPGAPGRDAKSHCVPIHFALADGDGVWHLERAFPYDSRRNKQVAAHVALWMVYRRLRGSTAAFEADPLAGRWAPSAAGE